jgi:hypothetical protein
MLLANTEDRKDLRITVWSIQCFREDVPVGGVALRCSDLRDPP